jgi:hypothetical protein
LSLLVLTNVRPSTEKRALSSLVLEVGKKLLREVLGTDAGMKYISPLYFTNERRPRNGKADQRKEYPPFKITFKHMSDAIEFKEKAIKASKDDTHTLFKSYVASHQNVGTRIRLQILWGIAEALKKEKKESWVTQGSPKPVLQVKQNATLVRSFGYVEAVTTYGDKIDTKVTAEAQKLASRFFAGQIEKIFLILKD